MAAREVYRYYCPKQNSLLSTSFTIRVVQFLCFVPAGGKKCALVVIFRDFGAKKKRKSSRGDTALRCCSWYLPIYIYTYIRTAYAYGLYEIVYSKTANTKTKRFSHV